MSAGQFAVEFFGFWNITTLVISRRHGIDETDGQTIVFNAKKKTDQF